MVVCSDCQSDLSRSAFSKNQALNVNFGHNVTNNALIDFIVLLTVG